MLIYKYYFDKDGADNEQNNTNSNDSQNNNGDNWPPFTQEEKRNGDGGFKR